MTAAAPGGDRTRLRNQMKRLFACTVSLIYEDTSGFSRVSSLDADKHEFWWDPKRPEERTLWDSKIRLGEAFFHEIIRHPVPLDMNILKALKRSSLALTFTCGSPTAPSRSTTRYNSPGSVSTDNSEWIQSRQTIMSPFRLFARSVCV